MARSRQDVRLGSTPGIRRSDEPINGASEVREIDPDSEEGRRIVAEIMAQEAARDQSSKKQRKPAGSWLSRWSGWQGRPKKPK